MMEGKDPASRSDSAVTRRAFVKSVMVAGAGFSVLGEFVVGKAEAQRTGNLSIAQEISPGETLQLGAKSDWLILYNVELVGLSTGTSRFDVKCEFTDPTVSEAHFALQLQDEKGQSLYSGESTLPARVNMAAPDVSHGISELPPRFRQVKFNLGDLDVDLVSRFILEVTKR